jgi:hypothetical protein
VANDDASATEPILTVSVRPTTGKSWGDVASSSDLAVSFTQE